MPYYIGRVVDDAQSLVVRSPEAFRKQGIDARIFQEKELQQLGLSYVHAKIAGHTRARYYPGTGQITVKILAEKGSGRLLGGQIVGKEGAGKRIDVLATALQGGMTVEDVINLDLGYSPPFSPVWDPVAIAARQVANLV
ncbi:MAG: hypothetical protein KKH04_12170 [Proteobacteria bacterium]|nr:hypothetical protein [Pseudomonadota bacterium]